MNTSLVEKVNIYWPETNHFNLLLTSCGQKMSIGFEYEFQ